MTRLITHLRHVDLGRARLRPPARLLHRPVEPDPETTDTGIAFLAAEGSPEQYQVRLRADAEKRIDLIAFGAATAADVDALAEKLGARRRHARQRARQAADPRRRLRLPVLRPRGPHRRGVRPTSRSAGTARSRRASRSRSSSPTSCINSADPEAPVACYDRHLDFALSDTLMHPHMGEMMWFLRCNPRHHSLAIARCPHVSLHHASFELRGIDEYMRGTGRLLRAGVEKIWGPGRHLAGNNTFSYFLDPHGNTIEYTTELESLDEDTWHPQPVRLHRPDGLRPVGHREPDERVRRQEVVQRPRPRRLRRARRSDARRHAARRPGTVVRAGVRRAATRAAPPRPAPSPCSTSSCGLRRPAGGRARPRCAPARSPLRRRAAAAAARAADGARLRRVRGARRGRRAQASTAWAASCPSGTRRRRSTSPTPTR